MNGNGLYKSRKAFINLRNAQTLRKLSAYNAYKSFGKKYKKGLVKLLKNWKCSVRGQFLVIAISLFIMTTILGLSAYLNTQGYYGANFKVIADGKLKISVTGEKHEDEPIIPGEMIDLDVVVKNESPIDVYLFAYVAADEMFFNKDHTQEQLYMHCWNTSYEINEASIYYYGNDDELIAVAPNEEIDLLDSVFVNDPMKYNLDYGSVEIFIYAIQTIGSGKGYRTIRDIWTIAKSI